MRRVGLRAKKLGSSSGMWDRFWLVLIFFCFVSVPEKFCDVPALSVKGDA